MTKITVLKFGSKTCGACIAMDRSKTLERLLDNHKNVEVVKIDIADEQGNSDRGTIYDEAYKLSDEYEVEQLPTLIFETPEGIELARIEEGVNYRQLEKTLEQAQEAAEYIANGPARSVKLRKIAATQKGVTPGVTAA